MQLSPQWQKMTHEQAIDCVRKRVVADAADGLVKHLIFSGEVRFASFEALLKKEGFGDVVEELDAAAKEVLRCRLEQQLTSLERNADKHNFGGLALSGWAAEVGGLIILQECYIQLLVEECQVSGRQCKGALKKARKALQKARAVQYCVEWLNERELRAVLNCQSRKERITDSKKIFEAALQIEELEHIAVQMDGIFTMHSRTSVLLGQVLEMVLRLPGNQKVLAEEEAEPPRPTGACKCCGDLILSGRHARDASRLPTEEAGLYELLQHDFVWEAYKVRGVDDPLLESDGQQKEASIMALESMLDVRETKTDPEFARKQLLENPQSWVWQSYTHTLLSSFSEEAFEGMLSFLAQAENRTFAVPLEALALSTVTRHVIRLSEARKQLSKGGVDQFDAYIIGAVLEAWARDHLLEKFFREVDLRRRCKYDGSLKVGHSFLLGLGYLDGSELSGHNLVNFLGLLKETLGKCEQALEVREGVISAAPPAEAQWLQVSFGRLEYEVREQRRLIRTLQGWLKRTGGDSSETEAVDISSLEKRSLLKSAREHIIEPRGSDAPLEHLVKVALEQKVLDPNWLHQWFHPLLQEETQAIVEDLVRICRSACWGDGPTDLPRVNAFLLEPRIVTAVTKELLQKLDDTCPSTEVEGILLRALEEEVLDARKLFLRLSPILKDHTQQFLKDLWESFPKAAWKENIGEPPKKAQSVASETSSITEEKERSSPVPIVTEFSQYDRFYSRVLTETRDGSLVPLEIPKAETKPSIGAATSSPLSKASKSTEAGTAASAGAIDRRSKHPSVAKGQEASAAALAALGKTNYFEEANGVIKDLQLGEGDIWVIQLSLYATGMGSDQMPYELSIPEYRGMTPAAAIKYLLDHCDRVTLWIFTWDLVRSPEGYFKGVCEYLQRPELGALSDVIRSMALGTLRLKAAELKKDREEAKREYERAKLEQLPATQLSRLHRWLLRAVAETPARVDLVKFLNEEVTTFSETRYANALSLVHKHFQEHGCYILEPFTASVVGESLTWLLGVAAPALKSTVPDLKEVDEGKRPWVTQHALLRGEEETALLKVLNEIKGGYERLDQGVEPKLHLEEVHRSKLNVPVIMKWVQTNLLEPGKEGEEVAKKIEYMLKDQISKELRGKELQQELESRLGRRGVPLMKTLWAAFLDAQEQPDGIPACVKAAADQAAAELLGEEGTEAAKKRRPRTKKKKKAALPDAKNGSAEEAATDSQPQPLKLATEAPPKELGPRPEHKETEVSRTLEERRAGGLPPLEVPKAETKPSSSTVTSNQLFEASSNVEAETAGLTGGIGRSSKQKSVAKGQQASAAALVALGKTNYFEEANGAIKDLQLREGNGWAIQLSLYATGLGSDQMPYGLPVPKYREMAPGEVVKHLLAHCDRITLWIFTWDLVRSPEEYFKGVCEYLQRPEMKALSNIIRSMAVGALRLKAAEIQTEREEAKREYEKAKLEQLPATQMSRLHRWMLRAIAETPARVDLVRFLNEEATNFNGTRYATALPFVHMHFQEYAGCFILEPFTAAVVGENLTWLLGLAAPVLKSTVPDLKELDEGKREWVSQHAALRGEQEFVLLQVLNELKGGYERLDQGIEPRLHFEEVHRSKLNVPVIMKWVETHLLEPGKGRAEVALMVESMLKDPELRGKDLQRELERWLGRKGVPLMETLWAAFLDAQEQPDGIPACVKAAADQAAAELLANEGSETEKKRRSRTKKKKKAALPGTKSGSVEETATDLQLQLVELEAQATSEVRETPKQLTCTLEASALPGKTQGGAPAAPEDGDNLTTNSRSRLKEEGPNGAKESGSAIPEKVRPSKSSEQQSFNEHQASTAALAELAERNFVEEASGQVENLQLGGDTLWRFSLKNYVSVCSAPALRHREDMPAFREMRHAEACEYLLAHCNRVMLWIFTLDLLQSPEQYFKGLCECLERPEMELLGRVVRSMAVGALRLRLASIRKEREEARDEYFRAKKEGLSATQASAFRAWIDSAIWEVPIAIDFLGAISHEVATFDGKRYAACLDDAHVRFGNVGLLSEVDPFTAPALKVTLDLLKWQVAFYEQSKGTDTVSDKEKLDADGKAWVQWNAELQQQEETALAGVLKELEEGYAILNSRTEPEQRTEVVHLSRLNVPTIMDWVVKRLLGPEEQSDEAVQGLRSMLTSEFSPELRPPELQKLLEKHFGRKGVPLMDTLWTLLLDAQGQPDGIPSSIKHAADKAAAELLAAEERGDTEEKRAKTKRRRRKKAGPAVEQTPASNRTVNLQPRGSPSADVGASEASHTPSESALNLEAKGSHLDSAQHEDQSTKEEAPTGVNEELPRVTTPLARPVFSAKAERKVNSLATPSGSFTEVRGLGQELRKETSTESLYLEEVTAVTSSGGISASSSQTVPPPRSDRQHISDPSAAQAGKSTGNPAGVPAKSRAPYNPLGRAVPVPSFAQPSLTKKALEAGHDPDSPSVNTGELASGDTYPHGDSSESPDALLDSSESAPEELLRLLGLTDAEHLAAARLEETSAEPSVQRSFELRTLAPIASILLPTEISHVPQIFPHPPLSESVSNQGVLRSDERSSKIIVRTAPMRPKQEGVKRSPREVERKGTSDGQDEDTSCCICFERPRNAALVPCGHMLCFQCSELIRSKTGECPLCSQCIQSVLKLHVP